MSGILPTQTYHEILKNKFDAEDLRNKLKLKNLLVRRAFSDRHPHVDKFFKEKGVYLGRIREHSAKILGAGAIAGSLFLSSPGVELKLLPSSEEIIEKAQGLSQEQDEEKKKILTNTLSSVLPGKARPLNRTEEKFLEHVFKNILGVNAKATLEGEHLNTTYGYIGAEQHLRRYPGDTMTAHPKVPEDDEGMAPGLGAWGYFASSKNALTEDLVEKEKWYAVVQTLYLPDWGTRQPHLKNWYKHRKVLIVNTKNGNAVVASIADSGPAAWTGKHFGGSPEVMSYLGGPRYKKGSVVLFFVDDPENKVSLGPVGYNKTD